MDKIEQNPSSYTRLELCKNRKNIDEVRGELSY